MRKIALLSMLTFTFIFAYEATAEMYFPKVNECLQFKKKDECKDIDCSINDKLKGKCNWDENYNRSSDANFEVLFATRAACDCNA